MASVTPKECGICCTEFDEIKTQPKILPCSHNVCGNCLDKMIEVQNRSCPFCLRSFKGNSSQSFSTNLPLLGALKRVKEMEDLHKSVEAIKDLDEDFEMLNIVDDLNNEDPCKEEARAPDIPIHNRFTEEPESNDYEKESSDEGDPHLQKDRSESPDQRNIRGPLYQKDQTESPDPRNIRGPLYQRDRSESPDQRNTQGPLYQRDRSESPDQRNTHGPLYQRDRSESPNERNICGPLYLRDRSESPDQRNTHGPLHQRDRSESPDQRNIHRPLYQKDRSESPDQRNTRGPLYQRDRSESPDQRNTHGPLHQRDRSELPDQRNTHGPLYQRDRSESPNERNICGPLCLRDRSESPDQRNTHGPLHQRDRSESPDQENIHRPFYQKDQRESPDQRNIRGLPYQRDRSESPDQRNLRGPLYQRDRSESPNQRNIHGPLYQRGWSESLDQRNTCGSLHQRDRSESPNQRNIRRLIYQRDRSESPNQRNILGSPHQRDRSESPDQRNLHRPLHQRGRSESPYQRNRHKQLHQKDWSESPGQRNIRGSLYQRDRSESPDQRNIRGPTHQRDRSESPDQRNIRGPTHQRDRSESPDQRNRYAPLCHRERSELPYQGNRHEPPRHRERSESPYKRNRHEPPRHTERSESPYQRNRHEPPRHRERSESPYQRNRHEPPRHRERSESPYQRNRHEPPRHRERSESPYKRKRGEPLHWEDFKQYQDQRNREMYPHTTDKRDNDISTSSKDRGQPQYQTIRCVSPHKENQNSSPHQRRKDRDQHGTPYQTKPKFSCFDLLSILIIAENFSVSTEALVQSLDAKPDNIKKLLEDYPLVFEENDGKITFRPQIRICSHFLSVQGCQDQFSCSKLHICPNYIFFSCPDENCILGHNIKSNHNQSILKPLLMNELPTKQLLDILSEVIPQSTSNAVRAKSSNDNSQGASNVYKESKSAEGNLHSIPHKTLWHDDYEGNTQIPEICYYSVTGKCRDEVKGCKRLHAEAHFHWQAKVRGVGWVNLRKTQVEALEKAYCNPNLDRAVIPALNKNTCQRRIFNLFGNDKWDANFTEMSMRNAKTKVKLSLRRLTTNVKFHKYLWYFKHQNNTWVQYGKKDTSLSTSGVSNVTSDDIERAFLKDPSSTLIFHILGTPYILDFNTMIQMNTFTSVRRAVKRRPVYHTKGKSHGNSLPFFY
ncbi:zinc finger CCCH domain-containing protein 13-like [Palaemon carinicauda]|uniref:zinc finger CCCH domain-containing protein 13-like n=1 Tax=Palaemon carinicauda TaxID=392227 RepID=UPI0035B611CA